MFAPLAQRISDRSAALNGSGLDPFSFVSILRLPKDSVVLARANLGKRVLLSIAGRVDVDFGAILTWRFLTFNRAAWHASARQPCRCRAHASHRQHRPVRSPRRSGLLR